MALLSNFRGQQSLFVELINSMNNDGFKQLTPPTF